MISFIEKESYQEAFCNTSSTFKTGIILEADTGYSNYPVSVNSSMELKSSFGYPTSSNVNYWYVAYTYLQYAKNLYIVRPCDTAKHNMNINFKLDDSVERSSDSNCYNPTVFSTKAFDLTNIKFKIVHKYLTSTPDIAVAICSSLANFAQPISVETNTVYVETLQNNSTNVVRKFNEFFEVKPKFSIGEFCIIVFKKNEDGLYNILDKAIASYDDKAYNYIEKLDLKNIYVKNNLNAIYLIDTCSLSIISTSFVSNVNTLSNSALTESNYLTATRVFLNIDINCMLDFEYVISNVKKTGLAAQVAHEKNNCFAIVGNYEYKKFLNKDNVYILSTLLSDYIGKSYLIDYYENTCIILNMQNTFDPYSNKKIWYSCIGEVAGLIASGKRFFSGLEGGRLKNDNPLLFEFTADMKTTLLSQNVNFVIKHKSGFNYNSSQLVADPIDESFKDVFNYDLISQTVKDLRIALGGYVDKVNIMPVRENAITDGKKVLDRIKFDGNIDDYIVTCDNTNNVDYADTLYFLAKLSIPRYIKEIEITFIIKDTITIKTKRG